MSGGEPPLRVLPHLAVSIIAEATLGPLLGLIYQSPPHRVENMRRPEEGGVPQLRRRGSEANKKDGDGPLLRKPPKQ
ncbi:MAG TPA: hypothetical protein VFA76_12845 [Terriglobales bacterium]|nr:hypothetical protein [Terriglobales bacterium]